MHRVIFYKLCERNLPLIRYICRKFNVDFYHEEFVGYLSHHISGYRWRRRRFKVKEHYPGKIKYPEQERKIIIR